MRDESKRSRASIAGEMNIATLVTVVVIATFAASIADEPDAARKEKLDAARSRLTERFRRIEEARPEVKLRLIGEAVTGFAHTNQRYPHATLGPQDQKGLSWRVWILPFFGRQDLKDLFAEFELDEPWDSPHNKQLIARMPDVYALPLGVPAGKSAAHLFTGPKTPMGDEQPLSLFDQEIAGHTILLVQGKPETAEEWTKPGGLPLDVKTPLAKLHSSDRGYLVSFYSGDVAWLGAGYPPEAFALQAAVGHGQSLKLNRLLSEYVARSRPRGAPGAVSDAGAAGESRGPVFDQVERTAQAMLDCYRRHQRFPGANYSPYKDANESGLSWRVHLLPFLGEADLYAEFHWDEPWDSEHNKQFVDRMPAVFRMPGAAAGKTRLHVFTGEGTPLGDKPPKEDYPYYLQHAIMFVLGGPETATEWTRPDGVAFRTDAPLSTLGSATDGGYPVVLFDGTIRLLPAKTSPQTARRLIAPERGASRITEGEQLAPWRPKP